MKSGNNEPSKSTSWKVLETVLSHLKRVAIFQGEVYKRVGKSCI